MKKISGLSTTDQNGVGRSIEWYQGEPNVRYVLRKGSRVTHNLGMTEEKVRKMFNDIMDVREHLADQKRVERAVPDVEDIGFSTRVQLWNDLSSSFSDREVRKMRKGNLVSNPTRVLSLSGLSGKQKDWEKTSEDVLQMVWNIFQEDWFTSREFIEEYNNRFDRNEARNKLLRMHSNGDFVREAVDKDEVEDGRINYKYKLSAMALRRFDEFDGFAVRSNPAYAKKKAMLRS